MRSIIAKLLILISTISYSQSNLIIYDLDTCQRDPSWTISGYSGSIMTVTTPEQLGCQMGCGTGCGSNNFCSVNTSFLTKGWNTVSTDPSRYYEFDLITFPNVNSDLHYIYFSFQRSSTGPTSTSVYVNGSLKGFSSISGTACDSLGIGIFQTYTGNVNFRIRFWGASSPDGTIRIDNIRVTYFSTTLPVELVDFNGEPKNNEVYLNWQTASESGSSHFEIQRSHNAKDWEKIGLVHSAGDSQSLINYYFWDRNVPNWDIIYYQLKQIDLNGDFEYSKTIAIRGKIKPIFVRDGFVYYSGEYPQEATVWDMWGRFIGNLSSGQKKLEVGIYFVNISGRVYKIAIE